jgi:group I intron endonuclease
MIGIYKITSPTNRIYIGQSNNIELRFKFYKNLRCKSQIRLYRSFLKHNVDQHKFEIIEECDIKELNNKERYWQDYYDVISNKGMNCILTNADNKSGKLSKFTKNKLSKSTKGVKKSPEHCKKLGLAKKGIKLSENHKLKVSLNSKQSKKVINLETNTIYNSIKEASIKLNINYRTLSWRINNNHKTLKFLNNEQ